MLHPEVRSASDKVSMCNFWANRLCCEAADRAMQVLAASVIPGTRPRAHLPPPPSLRITEGRRKSRCARWPAICSFHGPQQEA
jgi:hypothetical protein